MGAEVDLSFLQSPSWEDEWLDSELADVLGRPSTPKDDHGALIQGALVALERSEPVDPAQAFALLQCLRHSDPRVLGRLAVRPTASPLMPEAATSYVVCRRLCDPARSKVDDRGAIPVSFQSILNSEVWWSSSTGEGVASRPMSRCTRSGMRSGASSSRSHSDSDGDSADGRRKSDQTAVHGFRGRMYTLVAKVDSTTKSRKPKYVAVGDVSVVHTWAATDEENAANGGARSPKRQQSPPPPPPPPGPATGLRSSRHDTTVAAPPTGPGGAVVDDDANAAKGGPPPKSGKNLTLMRKTTTEALAPPPHPVNANNQNTPAGAAKNTVGKKYPNDLLQKPPALGPPKRRLESSSSSFFSSTTTKKGASSSQSTSSLMDKKYTVTSRTESGSSFKMDIGEIYDDDAILEAVEEGDADEQARLVTGGAKRPRCSGPSSEDVPFLSLNRTLQVRGDVHVSGFIFGQLATKPNAADYAEWFEWDPVHLAFDDRGKVTRTPPPGSVAQLRSPEQRLSLDTGGSGPCLIVSTSPSIAAGLPLEADVADAGSLVAFLGQVPVRCAGRITCGDQLVPSGRNDGTAVALRLENDDEKDLPARKRKNRRSGLVVVGGATDALGVAMESTPKETRGGDEHVILAFVRWNHAVRRELHDEIDKVVYQMHGTVLSALVYATAFASAGVLALLATLLIFDVFKASGINDDALKRQYDRLQNAIFLLGGVALVLFVAVAAVFTRRLPRRSAFLAFWLVFALLVGLRSSRSDGKFAIAFVQHALAFFYHGLLCHVALQLRKDQTRPNSVSCSPRVLAAAKVAAPFACIILIFLLVFLT